MNMIQHARQAAKNNRGFTLIELMIVVAIIGILAAIAIPQFSAYRQKAYNVAAIADARRAYTAVLGYFSGNPAAEVKKADIEAEGFSASGNVNVVVNAGNMATFSVAAYHLSGTKRYTIDAVGAVTETDI